MGRREEERMENREEKLVERREKKRNCQEEE